MNACLSALYESIGQQEGHLGTIVGHLGAFLDSRNRLRAFFLSSWSHLGPSGDTFGLCWSHLGQILVQKIAVGEVNRTK